MQTTGIDWSKPLETITGKPATLLYPLSNGLAFVEIGLAHLPYNEDGTPVQCAVLYPRLRNAEPSIREGSEAP